MSWIYDVDTPLLANADDDDWSHEIGELEAEWYR